MPYLNYLCMISVAHKYVTYVMYYVYYIWFFSTIQFEKYSRNLSWNLSWNIFKIFTAFCKFPSAWVCYVGQVLSLDNIECENKITMVCKADKIWISGSSFVAQSCSRTHLHWLVTLNWRKLKTKCCFWEF